jgi:hypothetical protein
MKSLKEKTVCRLHKVNQKPGPGETSGQKQGDGPFVNYLYQTNFVSFSVSDLVNIQVHMSVVSAATVSQFCHQKAFIHVEVESSRDLNIFSNTFVALSTICLDALPLIPPNLSFLNFTKTRHDDGHESRQ